MLKLHNLKSGYGDMEVLHGINLEVGSAELVSIIGPNGSGKSTILKSIFNLADVTNGKIIFKDKDITSLETSTLIDFGISFVPQGRQIFSTMTVLENLEMGAYSIKDKSVISANIKDVFEKFPMLKEKQNKFALSLSGGQQQLLAIARALIQNPQLLLLDEPSLGLAPKTMSEIFNKIIEIKNEGVSILMVEQNAKQAVEISNKTYIIKNGDVAMCGNRDVLNNPKIKDVFFGGNI
jgi:branched-chain amino acid transport system ATP-binding protein